MSREKRGRTFRLVAVLAVATVTVWLAARAASDREPGARALPRTDSGEWLRRLPGGREGVATVEVRLDRLLDEVAADGSIIVSSAEVERIVRGVLPADQAARPLESVTVGELLDRVRRVRVTYGLLAVTLERGELLALARQALGDGADVESMQVGELLERYPVLELSTGQVSTELQGRSLGGVLREALGKIERIDLTRDAGFAERIRLQVAYAEVEELVRDVRLEVHDPLDERAVYDEAFARLLANDRLDRAPLLDGHQRLQQEYAEADLAALDRAAQIAFRWDARRRAFGEELAARLFSRREAMERYEVDRLAIEADPALDADQRTARLRGRRAALEVEMASRGTYVGFPDEARAEVQAELRERYGERFDSMTEEERRGLEREVFLDRLPVEMREKLEGGAR
jgi:hypothetical protein